MDARFPGQWFQLETGLAYNWHRHYDPTTGRYIQPDPLGLRALLRDGPSLYGYAAQNPLSYWDPTGFGVMGRAIGGYVGGFAAGVAGAETGPFDVVIAATGRAIGAAAGDAIEDWLNGILNSDRLPLDKGGGIWGIKEGCGAKEGRRAAHEVKRKDPMSKPKDRYTIDPNSGEVYDPQGEQVGNAVDELRRRR